MTPPAPLLPEYLVIFVLGTLIGSFLNVIIYRLPRGESLILPASHCPGCNRPIRPWENIPIVSFMVLRGRCAGCKAPISRRYPAIEALTGALFALMLWKFGWSRELILYLPMTALFVALSGIDVAVQRLPNVLTYTGSVLAVILNLLLGITHWSMMILGMTAGLGLGIFMYLIGKLLFRRDGLGVGDMKLMMMTGLFGGWSIVVGMFAIGSLFGSIGGAASVILQRKGWFAEIPYGPYLMAAAVVSLVWGENLWRWYIGLAFR